MPLWVRLDFPRSPLRALDQRHTFVVADDARVEEPLQHLALGAERRVDRLHRHARLLGQRLDGGRGVAVPYEEPPRRVEHSQSGLTGLFSAVPVFIPTPGLDRPLQLGPLRLCPRRSRQWLVRVQCGPAVVRVTPMPGQRAPRTLPRAQGRLFAASLGEGEAGNIDAVVTWHNDRLHHSPKELEAFIDLVERSRVRLAVVTGGDYDLTTPTAGCRHGSSGRWPARSPRTGAGGSGASTSSWPSKAGPLANSGGAFEERDLVREAARRVLGGDGLMTIGRGRRLRCGGRCSRHGWPASESMASIRAAGGWGSYGRPSGRGRSTALRGIKCGPCC